MVKLIGDCIHTMTGLKSPACVGVPYLNLIINVMLDIKYGEK